jgi:hypothetical protein
MIKTWVARTTALACLALATFNSPAHAQIVFGSLVGNVADSSGSALAKATVTVTNTLTQQKFTLRTNEAGAFTLQSINPGIYSIAVSFPGFKSFTKSGVELKAGATVRADAQLILGDVKETIEVSARGVTLQSDTVEVRREINAEEVQVLPLALNRNYQGLVSTLPGWLPPESGGVDSGNPSGSMSIAANGGSSEQTTFRTDGAVSKQAWFAGRADEVPNADSIESVNVSSGTFDAEQGFVGTGAVNVQLKSGTNAMHGTAYGFHTDNTLKARPYYLPPSERQSKLIYNQLGGTLGGPIKKDKLFYFVSYDSTFDRATMGVITAVPSVGMRQGNFSQSTPLIYDPLTGNPGGSGRLAFANNVIPADRLSPIMAKVVAKIPMPNIGSQNTDQNNYWASGAWVYDRHKIDSKVTWNATQRLNINARVSYQGFSNTNPPRFGELEGNAIDARGAAGTAHGWVASQTYSAVYTVNPTFTLDGYYANSPHNLMSEPPNMDKNYGLDYLGIPGSNGTSRWDGGWPRLQASGYGNFGRSATPISDTSTAHQFSLNASKIKGSHDIRFGVDSVFTLLDRGEPMGDPGQFYFTANVTGTPGKSTSYYNTFATFMLGLPQSVTKTGVWDTGNGRSANFSLYMRDRWTVTRKLTLTPGLRWDYFTTPTRKGGAGFPQYNPATNQTVFCGWGDVSIDSCGYETSKKNFGPRFGAAYRLNSNTVIRAGYGISFDPMNVARNSVKWYPTTTTLNLTGNTGYDYLFPIAQGLPALQKPNLMNGVSETLAGVAIESFDPKFRRDYIQSWNLTMQKVLGGGWIGEVAYIASRTRHMSSRWDFNYSTIGGGNQGRVLYPKWKQNAAMSMTMDVGGNSQYDSLQASLNKRFSSGYMARFSYTHGRYFYDANNYSNPAYWGMGIHVPNANDRPHVFSAVFTAELPFGKGKSLLSEGIGSKLLGGWQTAGVYSFASGIRFSVTADGTSLNAPGNQQLADLVKTNVNVTGDPNNWFDATAYKPVNDVRFGTSGMNQLVGPWLSNLDLSVIRNFRLTERFRLQFRTEALNATNTPHFDLPNSNVNNAQWNADGSLKSLGTFTTITSLRNTGRGSLDERVVKFGLRLSF